MPKENTQYPETADNGKICLSPDLSHRIFLVLRGSDFFSGFMSMSAQGSAGIGGRENEFFTLKAFTYLTYCNHDNRAIQELLDLDNLIAIHAILSLDTNNTTTAEVSAELVSQFRLRIQGICFKQFEAIFSQEDTGEISEEEKPILEAIAVYVQNLRKEETKIYFAVLAMLSTTQLRFIFEMFPVLMPEFMRPMFPDIEVGGT